MDKLIGDTVCCNPWLGRPPIAADRILSCDVDVPRDDVLDRDTLGINASISFAAIRASGPPSRALEFPAPTVDRAVTVAAGIIDHRTGDIFLATNVLMRRPVHAKDCPSQNQRTASRSLGHNRKKSPGMIHSWHPVVQSNTRQKQHRRAHSQSANRRKSTTCNPACTHPEKAYCIRRKICNTTYGSIRLCVVLKRVSQNVRKYARAVNAEENQFHAQCVPEWETTDEMVAVKVVNWSKLQSLRGRHLEDPIKELSALQQLVGKTHPNITSVSAALQDEKHLFCVSPYIAGETLCGSLSDHMASSPTGRMDENHARAWFRQILSAGEIALMQFMFFRVQLSVFLPRLMPG